MDKQDNITDFLIGLLDELTQNPDKTIGDVLAPKLQELKKNVG